MTRDGGFRFGLSCFLAGWLLAGDLESARAPLVEYMAVLTMSLLGIAYWADYRQARARQGRRRDQ
jgi:hypothetical protein